MRPAGNAPPFGRASPSIQDSPSRQARVNWVAGLQALAAAWSLASVAVWYHNPLPLVGSAALALFALFGPLRLQHLIFSRSFLRSALSFLVRAAAVAALAFILSLAINSKLAILSAVGSVLFVVLLAIVATITLRSAIQMASRMIPVVQTKFSVASAHVRGLPLWSFRLGGLPESQEHTAYVSADAQSE